MADDPITKNTHRAVLACCYPPGMTPIASGSEAFCTSALEAWLSSHPLPQWTNAYVMRVEAETQCEPGVGVYTVPVDFPDQLRVLLADEDRAVEKLGQLVYDVAVDHPMWIGDEGQPLDYLPAREALIGQFIDDAARAVLAALREVAGNG